jgi:cytoskeletal protein CcmA (bactofilin family)
MFGKPNDNHKNMPLAGPATKHSPEPALADAIVSISRGLTVVGKIFGEGTVQLFGRIEGEVRASTVLIKEGAQIEGDLVAEEVIIAGQVKGTIHANRVKLHSTAVVQGDIFHRLLSIDENARFEGLSKREDNAGNMPGPSKVFWRDEPAAHDAALTIGAIGSPLSHSSTQDESQTTVTPVDPTDRIGQALTVSATDRVQQALDVVTALGGGSRLADLSSTAPPAEPRDSGAGALNGFASTENAIQDDDESGSDPKKKNQSKRLKFLKRNAKTE